MPANAPISIRPPEALLARIEAYAGQQKLSRHAAILRLLQSVLDMQVAQQASVPYPLPSTARNDGAIEIMSGARAQVGVPGDETLVEGRTGMTARVVPGGAGAPLFARNPFNPRPKK